MKEHTNTSSDLQQSLKTRELTDSKYNSRKLAFHQLQNFVSFEAQSLCPFQGQMSYESANLLVK